MHLKKILVSLLVYMQGFSSVSILEENCWINKVNEMLSFIRKCKTTSPDSCINLTFPSAIIEEIFVDLQSLKYLKLSNFLILPSKYKLLSHYSFNLHFLIIIKTVLLYLLAISFLPQDMTIHIPFAHFSTWLIFFLNWFIGIFYVLILIFSQLCSNFTQFLMSFYFP